ncbi:MAG: MBL fold metallo-hydrolase [Bryobacteraceae bacterium]
MLTRRQLAALALAPSKQKLFDIKQVHRHAWLAVARPAAMLNCNAAVFEQSDGLLVVDTHSKPSAAAALVRQLREEVSPKPVRYIIQTHFHYDHTQGTAAYPGVPVIGTAATRAMLATIGAQRAAANVESMRRAAAAAAGKPGEYWRRLREEAEAFVAEMRDYRPVLPDITFPDSDSGLVLHDRLQDLHLIFRGRAHTASDICVWSPEAKLLATGDLLTGFVPGMGDGFPLDWPATLRSVAKLDFARVLPGHGEVQEGKRHLALLTGYIEELNEAVSRAKSAGMTTWEVQNAVTPATLASFRGEFGRIAAATERRFRLRAPGSSAADAMARAVRANVARVYELTS